MKINKHRTMNEDIIISNINLAEIDNIIEKYKDIFDRLDNE